MSAKPDPAFLVVALDAAASDRRADALNILLGEGEMTLAEALDALTAPRAPQLGDILECSWGYEQTRVDFYQVTKITAKTISVRQIRKTYVSQGHGGQATVVPVAGAFDEHEKPLVNRRFAFMGGRWRGQSRWRYSIRVTDYSHAYLWDGEASHESGEH